MLAPGKVPVGDNERRLAVQVGQEPSGDGLLTLVGGTVGTERAEGGRVGAALGGEVPGEAEHVRPRRQPQVFQAGEFVEPDAFGNVTACVLADRQHVELVSGRDAAIERAGAFSGLGGVLGDVGRDPGLGQFPARGDGPGVEFAAPGERAGRQAGDRRYVNVNGVGGLGDGGGKQLKRGPARRGSCRPGRVVEPDDGVEMDDAAPLVFSDLGKGDANLGGKCLVG